MAQMFLHRVFRPLLGVAPRAAEARKWMNLTT